MKIRTFSEVCSCIRDFKAIDDDVNEFICDKEIDQIIPSYHERTYIVTVIYKG